MALSKLKNPRNKEAEYRYSAVFCALALLKNYAKAQGTLEF